eukprot:1160018-Pelagomonas_calceolata.AAC.7
MIRGQGQLAAGKGKESAQRGPRRIFSGLRNVSCIGLEDKYHTSGLKRVEDAGAPNKFSTVGAAHAMQQQTESINLFPEAARGVCMVAEAQMAEARMGATGRAGKEERKRQKAQQQQLVQAQEQGEGGLEPQDDSQGEGRQPHASSPEDRSGSGAGSEEGDEGSSEEQKGGSERSESESESGEGGSEGEVPGDEGESEDESDEGEGGLSKEEQQRGPVVAQQAAVTVATKKKEKKKRLEEAKEGAQHTNAGGLEDASAKRDQKKGKQLSKPPQQQQQQAPSQPSQLQGEYGKGGNIGLTCREFPSPIGMEICSVRTRSSCKPRSTRPVSFPCALHSYSMQNWQLQAHAHDAYATKTVAERLAIRKRENRRGDGEVPRLSVWLVGKLDCPSTVKTCE